jgi:hypothetical protein
MFINEEVQKQAEALLLSGKTVKDVGEALNGKCAMQDIYNLNARFKKEGKIERKTRGRKKKDAATASAADTMPPQVWIETTINSFKKNAQKEGAGKVTPSFLVGLVEEQARLRATIEAIDVVLARYEYLIPLPQSLGKH